MEPQDQKSDSPKPDVKSDADVKPEPETIEQQQSQQQQQQQQHPSSVIMRRQVITTAGTIEDETKAEQLSPEENTVKTSDASTESSPQNGTPQPVQYQEGREAQNRAAFEQEGFAVATTEGYNNNQNEYHAVSDEIPYTVTIQEHPHNIHIGGTHYEATEDAKGQIIYANLESVSSPFASNQHFNATDAASYMQQHQYQNYQQHYSSRSPDDSPPSNLVHRSDPTLASRMYSTVSTFEITFFITA